MPAMSRTWEPAWRMTSSPSSAPNFDISFRRDFQTTASNLGPTITDTQVKNPLTEVNSALDALNLDDAIAALAQ